MVDDGAVGARGGGECSGPTGRPAELFSEAVYILATSPETTWWTGPRSYTGRAIHANTIVRLLPTHVSERVHLLAGRLGTHPDASADDSTTAVWQALVTMDDEQLEDVARGICFITHDLTLSTTCRPGTFPRLRRPGADRSVPGVGHAPHSADNQGARHGGSPPGKVPLSYAARAPDILTREGVPPALPDRGRPPMTQDAPRHRRGLRRHGRAARATSPPSSCAGPGSSGRCSTTGASTPSR